MEEAVRDAIGDCPVCLEPILDPPIHQVILLAKFRLTTAKKIMQRNEHTVECVPYTSIIVLLIALYKYPKFKKKSTFQCQATHPLCYSCWKKLYKGGKGKCPTCRGKLSDKRIIPLEKILEKLEKKKCKFDGCNFERNNPALVADHEENCSHKTFRNR